MILIKKNSVLRHTLTKLKHSSMARPSQQWIRESKHHLLAEISQRQKGRIRIAMPLMDQVRLFTLRSSRKFMPSTVQVASVVVVIVCLVSTNVMAKAAVPGDVLWPFKITIEKAEVALAVNSVQESKVHIRHADNRLKELSVVISGVQAGTRKSENISEVVRRLERDITAANQSLKLTKEENNSDDVVVSLAKDINDKASEAVKLLEDNKAVIASFPQGDTKISSNDQNNQTISTSTDKGEDSDSKDEQGTSTPDGTDSQSDAGNSHGVTQVVNEVKYVNESITYSTLQTMISIIEEGRAMNRSEVTLLLQGKIDQQEARLAPLESLIKRITGNFLLHKNEAQRLYVIGTAQVEEANTLLALDNLSGSYRAMITSRDSLDAADIILNEVQANKGLEPEKPAVVQPVVGDQIPIPKEKQPVAKPVTIQTIDESIDLAHPTSSSQQ